MHDILSILRYLGYTNDLKIDLKGYDRLYLFYYSIESIQILFSLRYEYMFYKKIKKIKDYESRDCMTWIMERSTIVDGIFFLLLDRIDSNYGQFEVWVYTLQIIYIYILILCISGDILTWRTTNRAIAWPENGNTDL